MVPVVSVELMNWWRLGWNWLRRRTWSRPWLRRFRNVCWDAHARERCKRHTAESGRGGVRRGRQTSTVRLPRLCFIVSLASPSFSSSLISSVAGGLGPPDWSVSSDPRSVPSKSPALPVGFPLNLGALDDLRLRSSSCSFCMLISPSRQAAVGGEVDAPAQPRDQQNRHDCRNHGGANDLPDPTTRKTTWSGGINPPRPDVAGRSANATQPIRTSRCRRPRTRAAWTAFGDRRSVRRLRRKVVLTSKRPVPGTEPENRAFKRVHLDASWREPEQHTKVDPSVGRLR